jgi:hypothetical protein
MTADTDHPPFRGSTDRWENEGGQMPRPGMPATDNHQLELERYGIVPVQLTVFDWGGYRYSNARDAIAAAKRGAKSTESSTER